MSRVAAAKPKPAKKAGMKPKAVYLTVIGIVGFVSLPAFILMLIGSLPMFTAWLYDDDPAKSTGLTVAAMNLGAIIPYVIMVFPHGHNMYAAVSVLESTKTWIVIYAAAGSGWVILALLPGLARKFLKGQLQHRAQKIIDKQKELIQEWGDKVAR